jgi:hypothetical protein
MEQTRLEFWQGSLCTLLYFDLITVKLICTDLGMTGVALLCGLRSDTKL